MADEEPAEFKSPRLDKSPYLPLKMEIARTLQSVAETHTRIVLEAAKALEPFMEQMRHSLAETARYVVPSLDGIAHVVLELPERTRTHLAALASRGWYLDPLMDFDQLAEYQRLFAEEGPLVADAVLNAYFAERAAGIEEGLCNKFPKRASILSAAFRAHRNADYALSVPIFLAQADGICEEKACVPLFSRKDGKAGLAYVIARDGIDEFTAALLSPLASDHPLTFSAKQRKGLEGILNRHAIMHGESVSYNTQTNSAKAISLIGFVAWVVADLKDAETAASG